ncbi:unnamed protein product [Wuchereria bancrofti]|uniref:Uncharacterized protein n=2 Tax=Wuchereria bancrofti TaxID=6293 RepID=A0A3P7E4T3_WUCBA|nr:unnamed protein product [Wuchereria bancrofti]
MLSYEYQITPSFTTAELTKFVAHWKLIIVGLSVQQFIVLKMEIVRGGTIAIPIEVTQGPAPSNQALFHYNPHIRLPEGFHLLQLGMSEKPERYHNISKEICSNL